MTKKRGRPPAANPKVTRVIRIHPELNQYLLSLGKNQASPAIEDAIRNSPEYRVWVLTNSASQQIPE